MSTETNHEPVGVDIQKKVVEAADNAASCVGKSWPLHSFVTANPLAGFEDKPFHEAVNEAKRLFGANGYPDPTVLRKAWEDGRIDGEVLRKKLSEKGYGAEEEPGTLLDSIKEGAEKHPYPDEWEKVDAVLTKWLSVFFDQGRTEWSMPNRERGFYAAWREVAQYDGQIPELRSDLPDSPAEAVESLVSDYPTEDWEDIFRRHLVSLPGWTALIRWRAESDDVWQSEYPVTLVGYLAVRLAITDALGVPVEADTDVADEITETDELRLAWLEAWEETYRESLTEALASEAGKTTDTEDEPDAQLVFCIDTRSEIIRRHIESAGRYETHGYAGFFGVPMRYEGYGAEVAVDSHPPILEPEHHVYEKPDDEKAGARGAHDFWSALKDSVRSLAETLETNAATAFSYVEKAGFGYAVAMTARTLLPSAVYDVSGFGSRVPGVEEFCVPAIDSDDGAHGTHASEDDLPVGIKHEEKVEYAETAFELTGWEEFARLVVFVGHKSRTTNNPFDSALDCGACAANPGGPNARVLAAICNDEEVQDELRDRGFDIPEDTVFVAGEHDTTTDEITLFDSSVPESHREEVESLRDDLQEAREGAAEERAGSMRARTDGVRETERRAADWAETRPEWGLAGNASFVIGPRSLTENINLDGRVFLHSYDPSTDPEGDALEAIMQGPMVVTQWINSQYYFASVDNAVYGSGSKVTQNPVGNFGVFQGNGGDLMTGLPLQSLDTADDEPYHQPLRLTVVIHAPADSVDGILEANESLRTLVENGWLHLSVVDPEQGNKVVSYAEMESEPQREEREAAEAETSVQD